MLYHRWGTVWQRCLKRRGKKFPKYGILVNIFLRISSYTALTFSSFKDYSQCFQCRFESTLQLSGDINFDFQLTASYSPLPGWVEPRAGMAIPGAVRVPGQAAVGAGCAVDVAAMQGHLGNPFVGTHIQLLL